ncbi:MAG: type II toxin-antitoxin system RelE/ParE family toxin [Desulfovibrio sp.]|jgi:mRNA interferase RelE/StbE|nr:type II toxin-antitoxin system RelE/ParE family toxin [Desulfovibrio sp.]
MAWKVEITPEVNAGLKKPGTAEAQRILRFLFERLQNRKDTRETGELLKGNLREFWRYRVGERRIFCRLEDSIVTVFVVYTAHRSEACKTAARGRAFQQYGNL